MKKTIKGKMAEIIDFFLIQCPVSYKKDGREITVSLKGLTFEKMHYQKSDLNKLLNSMRKDIKGNLCFAKSAEEVLRFREEMKNNRVSEFIACTVHVYLYKTKSIFYHIRNSFAHGCYEYDEKTKKYTLTAKKGEKYKAVMVLHEKTLIEWINRFENKNF